MRYYLIAGEASGDMHASHLIAAIRRLDTAAQFRCFGGDMMAAEGAELVQHYRDLAYMGFWPVVRHLPTILRGMKKCQRDILAWRPDILILVDYPGFNLRMARFVKQHTAIPVAYYIAPKIWAWKEGRIRDIKRDTLSDSPSKGEDDGRPIIALLPGSRTQEVRDNLRRMLQAAEPYAKDYQLVLAAAPGLEDEFYEQCIKMAHAKWQNAERLNAQSSIFNLQFSIFNSQSSMINVVRGQTYQLLQHSTAALVTSGTATLETALFRVPQVVCYYIRAGRLASLAKRLFLKVPFISLVNLICGEEVVPELVAEQMTAANVRRHLASILPGGPAREAQLKGYERLAAALGEPGAAARAAKIIVQYVAMPSQQSITLKP